MAKGFDRADYGLLDVAVESWGLFVFVNLSPDPAPLATQLGDLPERFAEYRLDEWVTQRTSTYDVAANYKLIGENFMEYYHLPWVHPELNQVSKFSDHYRWQGPGLYTGMCTTPVSRNSDAGGWDGLKALSTLGPQDADSGRFVWLFPGTALVVLPNHAFVLFNRPVAANRTVETAVLLAHPESLDEAAGTPRRGSSSWRSSGTSSTARTSRSSSASRRASRTRPTAAGGCASASRSRCTDSRTW